ncbi:Uncharacterised protein [Mycobacteroides abscessus subsp. abscessus]|nr:Uncharacterised protein [Mycobacteroides abscessus subsp. abscessus]
MASDSMLTAICIRPRCKKPVVTVRHSSPWATQGRYNTSSRNSWLPVTSPSTPSDTVAVYTRTLTAISAQVIQARTCCSGLTWRTDLAPCWTHSTHCCPTGADRMQAGHTGRPHRTQRTAVARSGCQAHP